MQNINSILLIVQVLLSVSLIGLILIQQGKGAAAGAAFGSGASATVFGSQGSGSFLTKTTAVLATLFFITCMSLAYVGANREVATSIIDTTAPVEQSTETILQEKMSIEPSDIPPAASDTINVIEPATGTDGTAGSDLPPAD